MPAPLSCDLRDRIVRAVEGGSSIRQAALRFAVSPSAAVKLMRRFRASGSPAPARFGGHRRPILDEHEVLIRSPLDTQPNLSRRDPDQAGSAWRCGRGDLHDRTLAERAGLTRKKKSLGAAEQDRPDVAHERRRWRVWQRFMD